MLKCLILIGEKLIILVADHIREYGTKKIQEENRGHYRESMLRFARESIDYRFKGALKIDGSDTLEEAIKALVEVYMIENV